MDFRWKKCLTSTPVKNKNIFYQICTKKKVHILGLARLIEISVNRSIYKRKTIIDMKIQKSVTFNGCSVY